MHRYAAVGGMWVTGVASRGAIRLRVGGRLAARGRITVRSGGRMSGRLGGRRIHVRLPGFSSAAMASAQTTRVLSPTLADPTPADPTRADPTRADPVARLFGLTSFAKSSHLGLVPSRAR